MSSPAVHPPRAEGIQPRALRALALALVKMDFRGQHFTRATGTRPGHWIAPLFWVVGQCMTVAAVSSLVFFMRVDVWYYAMIHLSLSMLVLATTVLVEFQEVVLHPEDLEIIGPRPVSPRSYAAARFLNLGLYVGLMFLALNLMPMIMGCALEDSGWLFAPTYLLSSLTGSGLVVCAVVLMLSAVGNSPRLEQWKEILAWTQIVLILVLGYGAQMMFRDRTHAVELWGAFPPAWARFLPSAPLAGFVERALWGSPVQSWLSAGTCLALLVAGCALTYFRLAGLYRAMQPLATTARSIITAPAHVGTLRRGLGGVVARGGVQRAAWFLATTLLKRDAGLRVRCLMGFNVFPVALVLGMVSGQFGNPLMEREARLIVLPLLALYAIPMAVPSLLYQFAFSEEHEAAWLWRTVPQTRAWDVGVGICLAIQALLITPLCLILGTALYYAWRDPLSAAGHALLAWSISWPVTLWSAAYAMPAFPWSWPTARGSTTGPVALYTAAVGALLSLVAAGHLALGGQLWFYAATSAAALLLAWPLSRMAGPRFARRLSAEGRS